MCKIVLVYIQPFLRNLLLKYALQPKIAKNSPEPLFWGFKVIDVDKSKKSVISVCYDVQQVGTYLQPFSQYTSE